MKTGFHSTYIIQCHLDSTSVPYKQSEKEDIYKFQVEILRNSKQEKA